VLFGAFVAFEAFVAFVFLVAFWAFGAFATFGAFGALLLDWVVLDLWWPMVDCQQGVVVPARSFGLLPNATRRPRKTQTFDRLFGRILYVLS